MRDVFISHAEEDAAVALAIARGLNAAGYSTWCYEDDSDPGPSYLSQIDEELEATQAVVLVISPRSLASRQVLKEVVRAHEAGKPFIPVRVGVDHETMQQQRDWRMALGASVSIAMPADGVEGILPRIVRGLERSGVHPAPGATRHGVPETLPPRIPASSSAPSTGVAAVGSSIATRLARVSDPTRTGITTVFGLLGLIGSYVNVSGVLNPAGQAATLYRLVPVIAQANLVANVAGFALNALLLHSAWLLYAGRTDLSRRVRLIAGLMLIAAITWLVVVSFGTLFPPFGRPQGMEKLAIIWASLLAALLAATPAVILRLLFAR